MSDIPLHALSQTLFSALPVVPIPALLQTNQAGPPPLDINPQTLTLPHPADYLSPVPTPQSDS